MEFPCFHCDTVTVVDVSFEVAEISCPNCRTVYAKYDGQYKFKSRFLPKIPHEGLHVGKKGLLKGIEYTITGILTKKVHQTFYWKEYILVDTENNFVYLSESNGHWILLKEIEDKIDVSKKWKKRDYNGVSMDLYEHTQTEIVDAQGFFDFEIPSSKINMAEYIAPPFILSVETIKGLQTASFGEHISAKEVKSAFSDSSVLFPGKYGIGLVQPFLVNVKNLAIIVCAAAIVILVSHLLIYEDGSQKEVLNNELMFDEYSGKDFVSPSFTLTGGSAPMTVSVYSNVDNSWANVQLALINEITNEEVYASKDVEYYHGYTDGESWKEGDKVEKFNICGVTAGRYHFTVNPQRQPQDTANSSIKVKAVWNEPSMWNVGIPIVMMIGVVIGMYLLNKNFEQRRWEESDFSPFE